jgi:hypothetical protein
VSLAAFDASPNPVERARTGMINAIHIVEFLWPVNANTEKEFILMKEATPFIIQQHTVCLQRIADLLAGASVLALEFNSFLEEIHAHQRRLSTLPGEAGHRKVQLYVIPDEGLKDLVTHPLPARPD